MTVPVGRDILDLLIEKEKEYLTDDSVSVLKIVSYVKENLRPGRLVSTINHPMIRRDAADGTYPAGTEVLKEEDIHKAPIALKSSPSVTDANRSQSINSGSTKAVSSVFQAKFSDVSQTQISELLIELILSTIVLLQHEGSEISTTNKMVCAFSRLIVDTSFTFYANRLNLIMSKGAGA